MNTARFISTEGHFHVNTQQDPKQGRILIKKEGPPPMNRLEQFVTGCIWVASIGIVVSIATTMTDEAVEFFKGVVRVLGAI